jgi:AcrR family transcriptional regulator
MPRVSDSYREARRAEIADAALRAFRRKGFQAASMADIITESGLSAGAIYGHFKGKADIAEFVAGRIVDARLFDFEGFIRLEPMRPPGKLVEAFLRGAVGEMKDTGMLVQLWGEAVTDPAMREVAVDVLRRLGGALRLYIALWHQREHGLGSDEAEAIAATQAPLFISACQGYILQSTLVPEFDGDGYMKTIVDLLPR